MFKLFQRLFTKNLQEIPLLWINFNYKLFKEKGKDGSCMVHLHPNLKDDEHIKQVLNELVDYIRNNYDMGDM